MRPSHGRDWGFLLSISIHALHYRVRQILIRPLLIVSTFQSTHSITECDAITATSVVTTVKNFNPRTPLQSATQDECGCSPASLISIHALHYRVRPSLMMRHSAAISFQSTHSITECDGSTRVLSGWLVRFQSTHSITECDKIIYTVSNGKLQFQSTHSITECD